MKITLVSASFRGVQFLDEQIRNRMVVALVQDQRRVVMAIVHPDRVAEWNRHSFKEARIVLGSAKSDTDGSGLVKITGSSAVSRDAVLFLERPIEVPVVPKPTIPRRPPPTNPAPEGEGPGDRLGPSWWERLKNIFK